MTEQKLKRRAVEFSKLILGLVLLTYFVGVIIGAYVVLQLVPDLLGTFLAYIGAPTGVAIAFYSWKARAENMLKLGWNRDITGETEAQGSANAAMQTMNTTGPFIEP